jgi:hypothetical protein
VKTAWGEVAESVSHMVRVVAFHALVAFIAFGFYKLCLLSATPTVVCK